MGGVDGSIRLEVSSANAFDFDIDGSIHPSINRSIDRGPTKQAKQAKHRLRPVVPPFFFLSSSRQSSLTAGQSKPPPFHFFLRACLWSHPLVVCPQLRGDAGPFTVTLPLQTQRAGRWWSVAAACSRRLVVVWRPRPFLSLAWQPQQRTTRAIRFRCWDGRRGRGACSLLGGCRDRSVLTQWRWPGWSGAGCCGQAVAAVGWGWLLAACKDCRRPVVGDDGDDDTVLLAAGRGRTRGWTLD